MEMNGRKLLRIAVVGAGVAGCLIVHGLQNEEAIEVICIEAGPEANVLAGTGLNVGPNALKVLHQFNPELTAALQAKGVSLPWLSWQAGLTDGTVLMDLPLSHVADYPGIRIRWSELYHQLRSQIAGQVHYNTRVVEMGYAKSAAGPLFLVVENQITGERQTFEGIDLIVGCDGRYSQVRQTFFGPPKPTHLGVCIYRLLVPNTPDRLIDDYQQWFYNSCRLLTFAIPGDEVYVAGSFPLAADLAIPDKAKTPDFLWNCYQPPGGYSPVCHFLVTSICQQVENIHWARIQEIPPVFGDTRGHVLCLGDSSHAMVPTLGQGATQAVEDACCFAAQARQFLAQARQRRQPLDVPSLVAKVEAERRDRIEFVQRFSRDASDSLLAGSNPTTELIAKTQAPFLEKLVRLYGDTPDVDL